MSHRHRFRISKKDLKLFMFMCLIALVVGAGIAVIDDKSRSMLKSLQDSAVEEIKHQAELYKAWEAQKKSMEAKKTKP
jgi:hypothetical protein